MFAHVRDNRMECNLSEFHPPEVLFGEEIPSQLVLIVFTCPLSKEKA